MLKVIANRIYEDFFMPSRLKEYEDLIKLSLANGYEHITIYNFFLLIKNNQLNVDKKYFIHRHDIDSDVKTARRFFEIEKKLNIKTSYYFRLSTLDYNLMREIEAYGSEASYHYEELASYCKQHKIKTSTKAKEVFDECRTIFKQNLLRLEKELGYKFKTVASHGDFVNRKLNIPNHEFVTNELLSELAIDVECYDKRILSNLSFISSDTVYPIFYRPKSPIDAIKEGLPVVYLLTHPRHWQVNVKDNIKENVLRVREGISYNYF